MIEIDVTGQGGTTIALWDAVATLVDQLPAGWVLVGGLMVQLHLIEGGGPEVRVTTDIDLLGQARPEGALVALSDALRRLGFGLGEPDEAGYSHHFTRGELVVDLLAPDGLGRGSKIFGTTKTVGIPGGSQAIARCEQVHVRTASSSFALLRPSLLGAILIKARALLVHRDPDAQLQDLISLLAILPDPSTTALELKGKEQQWLARVRPHLDSVSPGLTGDDVLRTARLALTLLAPPV